MGVGVIGVVPIYTCWSSKTLPHFRKPQKLIFLHLDFCKATKQPVELNNIEHTAKGMLGIDVPVAPWINTVFIGICVSLGISYKE